MEDHFEGGREVEMRRRMRQAPDPLAMLRTVAARAPTRSAILHLRTASDAEPEGYNYAEAAEAAARLAAALAARASGRTTRSRSSRHPCPRPWWRSPPHRASRWRFRASFGEAMASQLALAKARAVIAFGSNSAVRIDRTVASGSVRRRRRVRHRDRRRACSIRGACRERAPLRQLVGLSGGRRPPGRAGSDRRPGRGPLPHRRHHGRPEAC